MDIIIRVVNSEEILNSWRSIGNAGAKMLDEIGETIMDSESTRVAIHRFGAGQFFGFAFGAPIEKWSTKNCFRR